MSIEAEPIEVGTNSREVERKEEKAMAPNSRTLAWKIAWTEEPGGLQSVGSL